MATTTRSLSSFVGTVHYKSQEGGFFALVTKDNQHFTLHHLPAEFKRDGLVAEVTGSINEDILTFTQFGKVLEVESVTIINADNAKPPGTPAQKKSL